VLQMYACRHASVVVFLIYSLLTTYWHTRVYGRIHAHRYKTFDAVDHLRGTSGRSHIHGGVDAANQERPGGHRAQGQVGGSVKPHSLNIQAWQLRSRLIRMIKRATNILRYQSRQYHHHHHQLQQQQQQHQLLSQDDVHHIAQCAAKLIQAVWRMWRLREWLEQEYDRTMVELQISSLRYQVHMRATYTRQLLAVVRRLQAVFRARVVSRLRQRSVLEDLRYLAIIHPALQTTDTTNVAQAHAGYGRGNTLIDRR
jgi:hypothetical protein